MNRISLPVLGSFGKAIKGSVSLNFSRSGTSNCDPECAMLKFLRPNGKPLCYAENVEKRVDRKQLLAKLERHEAANPAQLTRKATKELEKRSTVPWLRISTNGSVPFWANAEFAGELVELLRIARFKGAGIHFPVESQQKAQHYRTIVGDLCTVRETCQTEERWLTADGASSFVAGDFSMTPRERVALAKRLCVLRTESTGRTCKVCPAVAHQHLHGRKIKNEKTKCGSCTLCDRKDVDIVYPAHK